jgi:type IX secretion system PorP/SprF family membrane protein
MRFGFIILLLLLAAPLVRAQQDPLYNLYFYNQQMINPAYTGLYKEITMNLITRKQWVGINGSPLTNFLSIASSVKRRAGVGLALVDDRLGVSTVQEGQLSFSYKVIEKEGTVLSLGVQGGLINYHYDYSRLNLQYLDDTDLSVNMTKMTKPNVGTGLFFRSERFFFGVSVPRILNVDVTDGMTTSTRYMRHVYVSGGMLITNPWQRVFHLKPSFLWRIAPGGKQALDLNLHALLAETIWVGATIRNFNAVGLNTQFQLLQRLRAGYSFELPTSSLISRNFGTHELSLMISLSPLSDQHKVIRYF